MTTISLLLLVLACPDDAPKASPRTPTSAEVAECLAKVKEYHGSVGPWAVVGYRMGNRAVSDLGLPRHSFSLRVTHRCPAQPRYACMADGLQAATGATPGKLNLRVEEAPLEKLASVVEDTQSGRKLTFTLRPDFAKSISDVPKDKLEEAARRVATLPDSEIFDINDSK